MKGLSRLVEQRVQIIVDGVEHFMAFVDLQRGEHGVAQGLTQLCDVGFSVELWGVLNDEMRHVRSVPQLAHA